MNRMIFSLPPILFICTTRSAAAPTPFSFSTRSPLTRLLADNDSIILPYLSHSNLSSSRQYPRDLSNPRDELQSIPNAFFPTYGIVLLVLFIVICVLSSVLVLITMHSRKTRKWIDMALGRVYSRFTRRRQGSRVHKDNQRSQRGSNTEKNGCDSPLDISAVNGGPLPSSPYIISRDLINKPKAMTSDETVTTIPDAPFSESDRSPSPSGQKRSASKSPLSPHDPRPPQPFSPLLDHLQRLLSSSKRMLQFLTADPTSRPSAHSPSTKVIVTADASEPTLADSDAIVPSPSVKRTDSNGVEIMNVEGDIGCQDTILIHGAVTGTQQIALPRSNHSTTHSSTPIRSQSGFYTLSGDAQLSASTAFHSFIDLSVLAIPRDTHSDTVLGNNSDDEPDPVISPLSPRYIHGVQLETIHEESDVQNTSLTLASSTSAVRDDSPLLSTKCCDTSDAAVSTTCHVIPTRFPKLEADALRKAQSVSSCACILSSLTDTCIGFDSIYGADAQVWICS
jgi:hypothetical protein